VISLDPVSLKINVRKIRNPTYIVIVSTEFPPGPGGIGQHAFDLAQSLVDAGYNITVITEGDYATVSEVSDFDRKHSANNHFDIIRHQRKKRFNTLYRLKEQFRFVIARQPNVIILTGRFSIWFGGLIKWLKPQTTTWAFVHGTEVGQPSRFLSKFTIIALSKADRIIAVSNFTKQLLPEKLRRHTEVIANGLYLKNLPASEAVKPLSSWIGTPCILTVGRVSARKGQHRVIKALPAILRAFPEARYHIVGLPEQREALQQLAISLGVERSVTFHGRLANRSDLYRAYKSADVFAMLSENQPDGDVEGFGIAILEANYFGVPVIGSKGCGIEDAIQDNYNGFMVDGDDTEGIAHAISKCLERKDILSANARIWAMQHEWMLLAKQLMA
jgi:phosphatidylinositol alpha-1,6-mannosyltransferase